jgi:hypothetical protein
MNKFNPNGFLTGKIFDVLLLKEYMDNKPFEMVIVTSEDIKVKTTKAEDNLPDSYLELRKVWPELTDETLNNTYYVFLEIKDNLILERPTFIEVGPYSNLFRVPTHVASSLADWFFNATQKLFSEKETTITSLPVDIESIPRDAVPVGHSELVKLLESDTQTEW